MDTHSQHQDLIDRWARDSVSLAEPASDDQIDATFLSLGIAVSKDVRALYRAIGGFKGNSRDRHWRLWTLDRLLSKNKERESDLTCFADWLWSSHMYGIRFRDDDHSEVYIGGDSKPPELIAGDMNEFLKKYAKNPDDVYAWTATG